MVGVQPVDGLEGAKLHPARVHVVGQVVAVEAADVVADVAQAGGRLVRREPASNAEHVPGGRCVTGELHGVAAFRPWAEREVGVDAARLLAADPGEREAAQAACRVVARVRLVDAVVRGDVLVGGRDELPQPGAVVQPPLADALLFERVVQVQVRVELGRVGPVEVVVAVALGGAGCRPPGSWPWRTAGRCSRWTGGCSSRPERFCCLVQFMKLCGSGNSAEFQFQPFHCDGDFQSVSTTSQSIGVNVERNVGSSVFS